MPTSQSVNLKLIHFQNIKCLINHMPHMHTDHRIIMTLCAYQLKANVWKVQAKRNDILTFSHLLCHFNIAYILSVASHYTSTYVCMSYGWMFVWVNGMWKKIFLSSRLHYGEVKCLNFYVATKKRNICTYIHTKMEGKPSLLQKYEFEKIYSLFVAWKK